MIPALFFIVIMLLHAELACAEKNENITGLPSSPGIRRLLSLPGRSAVGFYKFFITNQDIPTCNFEPTCSMFSLGAYKTTDPFQATFMSFDRLTRCNYWIYGEYPFHKGKFIDPVENHMLWGSKHLATSEKSHDTIDLITSQYDPNNVAESSNPEANLAFAEAMYREGETALALEEYLQLSGDKYSGDIRIQALFHSGWILYETERIDDSARTFGKIKTLTETDSNETRDASLLVYFVRTQQKQNDTPVMYTDNVLNQSSVIKYISVWENLQKYEFAAARQELGNLAHSPDAEIAEASRTILEKMEYSEKTIHKKGWISGTFSLFAPGLGRVYTGRYGDAAFSSGATLGTMGLAYRAVQSGPWTKAAFFCGTAAGFYAGNVYGSILSARNENHRKKESIFATLKIEAESQNILPHQIIRQCLAHRLPSGEKEKEVYKDNYLASQSLSSGNTAFSNKQWRQAVRCYHRYLYFSPEHGAHDIALFRLGKSLEYLGEEQKAVLQYEQILDAFPKSEYIDETRITLAHLHFRENDSVRANLELDDEITYSINSEYTAKARYLKTWIYLRDYNWNGAQLWLDKYETDTVLTNMRYAVSAIDTRLQNKHKIKHKSPGLARFLSIFVPGLGQTYAGKPWNGLGAFLVNGSIIYSMAHSVESENWLDTGLITVLLFHRFYLGNLYNAERFSHDYNIEQNERFFKTIRNDVRAIDTGLDPYTLN